MTSQLSSSDCDSSWIRLLDAYDAWLSARATLFQDCGDRVPPVLAKALEQTDRQRALALELFPVLSPEQQVELFPAVLELAIYVNGTTALACNAIRLMPREWVVQNILSIGKGLLANAEEVYGLVTLCASVDRNLGINAAKMASEDARPEIRDAGERCLMH